MQMPHQSRQTKLNKRGITNDALAFEAVRLAAAVEVQVLTVVVKVEVPSVVVKVEVPSVVEWEGTGSLSTTGSLSSEDGVAAPLMNGSRGNKRTPWTNALVMSATSRVWLPRRIVKTTLKAYTAWSTSSLRGKCK